MKTPKTGNNPFLNLARRAEGINGKVRFMGQVLAATARVCFLGGVNGDDRKLIATTLKEMNRALKIFAPHRDTRKVVIWGSSRVKNTSPEYKMALEFSEKITKEGFMVITGAGSGIMEAANRGAGRKGFGINIDIPMEQEPNPYIKPERLLHLRYFFTRKLTFIRESDAIVLFPGGFGTNDETFEILILAQTGKIMPMPIVLVKPESGAYWKNWMKFVEGAMLKNRYISEDDLKLFTAANSVDQAVNGVTGFYNVYHSMKYVGPLTIIRLNRPLSDKNIEALNQKFKDILVGGRIESSAPTAEEIKDNDYLDLPRLSMTFNKGKFGRLYDMIRAINTF